MNAARSCAFVTGCGSTGTGGSKGGKGVVGASCRFEDRPLVLETGVGVTTAVASAVEEDLDVAEDLREEEATTLSEGEVRGEGEP